MDRKVKTKNHRDSWVRDVRPYLELVEMWARNGLTDKQIALQLGISKKTFNILFQEQDEFYYALLNGRRDANMAVENALFRRAVGYLHTQVEKERQKVYDEYGDWTGEYKLVVTKKIVKEVLPSVEAQKFWLRSRLPERWGDKATKDPDDMPDNFIEALTAVAEDVWGDDDGE